MANYSTKRLNTLQMMNIGVADALSSDWYIDQFF